MRICTTRGIPRFIHDGLEVTDIWQPFDFAKAKEKVQQALLDHVGRYVQIHPDDVGGLGKLGLELVDPPAGATGRRLRRVKKGADDKPVPPAR